MASTPASPAFSRSTAPSGGLQASAWPPPAPWAARCQVLRWRAGVLQWRSSGGSSSSGGGSGSSSSRLCPAMAGVPRLAAGVNACKQSMQLPLTALLLPFCCPCACRLCAGHGWHHSGLLPARHRRHQVGRQVCNACTVLSKGLLYSSRNAELVAGWCLLATRLLGCAPPVTPHAAYCSALPGACTTAHLHSQASGWRPQFSCLTSSAWLLPPAASGV